MPTIVCNLSALAVATLFYYWRTYHQAHVQSEMLLRDRVAYMLWTMAQAV